MRYMGGIPKLGNSHDGRDMHYSVGAVIKRVFEGIEKYALVERVKEPKGYAGVAGHVDAGESEIEALAREVKEESGLKILSHKLLFEEEITWNWCSKGVSVHHWYLYDCETKGNLKLKKDEAKSIGWYSVDEIKGMASEGELEPVWKYWFEKLKVI
jgi:8-oxo-dGTP pyrophosphatase MutT (NUDIX family)